MFLVLYLYYSTFNRTENTGLEPTLFLLSKYLLFFFSFIFISCSFCLVFLLNILFKLSFHLIILFGIFHQTKYFFMTYILFLLFFNLIHSVIHFLFCSIFNLYSPLLLNEYFLRLHLPLWWNWLSLLSYYFTNILFIYFAFLSFLTSLNFQSNFGPH